MEATEVVSAWITAAVGLLGVLIGSGITVISSYLEERRREARDERRATAARKVLLRQTARLIEEQFIRVEGACASAHATMRWWPDAVVSKISTSAWEEYRAVLAAELTDDDWVTLLGGIVSIEHLLSLRASNAESHSAFTALPSILAEIRAGRAVLGRLRSVV